MSEGRQEDKTVAVLVVDLDRSLVMTDTLHESLVQVASRSLLAAFGLIGSLGKGKAAFKAAVAAQGVPDAALLPLNPDVVALIARERAGGRRIVLVSAADQAIVNAVASRLALFDEAFGSDGQRNLSGAAKAAFLSGRYGEGGYHYVGDAWSDVAVWKQSGRAITVGAKARLRGAVDRLGRDALHLSPPAAGMVRWLPYLKAIRPHQWLKNVLVFLPLMAAHEASAEKLLPTLVAFVAFCLTASSTYLVNDLFDLAADRAHPRKKNRPMASGTMPIAHGVVLAGGLLLAAVVVCLVAAPPMVLAVLALYYALTLAYSLALKRRLVIDICTLAGLYTLRILGGAVAATLPLSPWILAFSVFLFLSLAAMKRQAELVQGLNDGRTGAAGRAYEAGDLPIVAMMAIAAGYISVMVMALYISSPEVQALYKSPVVLWGICPVLLYWVSRMVMIAHRGRMNDDPVVFAVTDKVSLACGACILIIALSGSYL